VTNFLKTAIMVGAASLSLTACASAPGGLNGFSSDPMAMTFASKHPDAAAPREQEWSQLARMAHHCKNDFNRQGTSVASSALTQATLSAGGGALGNGGGIGFVSSAASASGYAAFGAANGIVQGAVSGVVQHSQNRATAIGNCAGRHFVNTKTQGVDHRDWYVQGTFIATRNRTAPPSWVVRGGSNQTMMPSQSRPSSSNEDFDMPPAPPPAPF
jgi:hypothetical protein